MIINRSIIGGLYAALALGTLFAGIVGMDQAHAMGAMGAASHVVGYGSMTAASLAMAGMVSLKAPVTVYYNGQYVAPGTVISVSEAEAARLTAAHGAYGGPGEVDPANTQMRNVDIASINALNEHASIHKGHGAAPEPDDGDDGADLKRSDLERMNRDKLVGVALELGVDHPADATKAQIVDAILAAQEAAKA